MSSPPRKTSPTATPCTNFSFPKLLLPPLPSSIFEAKVSVKLDEENFLIWRLLVEPVIKGHRLHMFLTDSAICPNAGSGSNDDFEEKDQILFSWILSTLSESMLARVIGCTSSKELWEKLNSFFKNRARAKVTQYQSELKKMKKKDTESISEYVLRIKILIDSLDFAGQPVTLPAHLSVILRGLPQEYYAAVTRSQNDAPFSVEEIEYMLMVHEVRIEEKNKVENKNESDRQSQMSFNGRNFSEQKAPFFGQYLPNPIAQIRNNRMPPNLMTMPPHSPHPHLQPPQYSPRFPPSYSSTMDIHSEFDDMCHRL